MKAAVIRFYGPPEKIKIEEIADPRPKDREVLVRVESSSVNPIDWKIRGGSLWFMYGFRFPKILGFDLSGEVVETGPQATRFKPGDQVYARSDRPTGEACAELVAVGEDALALKPESLSHAEAASIPLAALTALQAMRDKGGLKAGGRVLILGASGGVGSFAVQIAKALGAEVVAVCGGANREWVLELGADKAVDYRTEKVADLRERFEVVFDAVGGYGFAAMKRLLTPEGVYVSTLPGPALLWATAVGNLLSRKKGRMIWVEPLGKDLDFLSSLVESGRLKPVIDSEFALAELAEAHRRSQSHRVRGKIVVRIA